MTLHKAINNCLSKYGKLGATKEGQEYHEIAYWLQELDLYRRWTALIAEATATEMTEDREWAITQLIHFHKRAMELEFKEKLICCTKQKNK
jgi:hypothetical protein